MLYLICKVREKTKSTLQKRIAYWKGCERYGQKQRYS